MFQISPRKYKDEGFTIIEVIIVLAISGLILSLIFLAIPTLTRNSRNNQRKQDVTAILDAVSSYQLNNSGNYPNTASFLDDTKLTYYDKSAIRFLDADIADASIAIIPRNRGNIPATLEINDDADKVIIYNYRKCDAVNLGQATYKGAGYRDMVALFGIETRSASAPKCLEP